MRLVCKYPNMLQNGVDSLIRSDLGVIKIVIYIAYNKRQFSRMNLVTLLNFESRRINIKTLTK